MMNEILFNFKGKKTRIQGELNFSMKDNLKAFINKLNLYDINLSFAYKNEAINEEITLKEFVATNKIENNQIEIIVNEENEDKKEILSEEIICPECKQEAIIIVTDDKIAFISNQNHIKEIPKNEFKKSQMIAQSSTKCKCGSNQKKTFCLTCKKSLCSSCEKDHKKDNNKHIIIDYSQKNFCCSEHNKCKNQFICYCKDCNMNLCSICCDSHSKHQIQNLNEIYKLKEKLISKHKAFSSILEKLEQSLEELQKLVDNLRSTKEMNEIIIKNYNIENRNYIKLNNYKEIYEKNFNLQKINQFLTSINNIIKINNNYQEININNVSNDIKNEEMIKEQNQEIKEQNQEMKECNSIISFNKTQFLSISHNSFYIQRFYEKIENNTEKKNNMDIIANDQNSNENEEQEDEEISENKENNNIKNIESSDEIIYENKFSEDDKVLSDIKENEENENEKNINSYIKKESKEEGYNDNENNQRIIQKKKVANRIKLIYRIKDNEKIIRIFGKNFVKRNKNKCHIIYINKKQKFDLKEYFVVPDDHKGNLEIFLEGIDKIIDASEMFYDCGLLIKLEFISEWDTSNIINMSKMFENCESLEPFPNISKWNLVNVTNIRYMFCRCKYLKFLPDLSGWNTNNITNMSHLFENCESLLSLPGISKWNFINVTNIECMFYGCKSLKSLPDLSSWNTKNITNMSHLFEKCESLSSLPDLSRWNTNKVINMSHLFDNCESLLSLPDISKWDISNVKYMEYMFSSCLGLKEIIIFKKVYKVENISYLYYGCDSLQKAPDLEKWKVNEIKKKENFNCNCFSFKKK